MSFFDDLELYKQASGSAEPTMTPGAKPLPKIGKAPDMSQFQQDLSRINDTPISLGGVAQQAQAEAGTALREANKRMAEQEQPEQVEGDQTIDQMFAETGNQDRLDAMRKDGVTDEQILRLAEAQKEEPALETQSTMLGGNGKMGTPFGRRQGADIYSGGVNYGTDIIVKKGTKVSAPDGNWKVVEAYDKATAEGPKNRQRGANRGYGNSVLLENTETGEKLRFSHLTVGGVNVAPGDTVKGGQVIGKTGATGNTAGASGQHLDLEYYNTAGRLADVMKSQYRKSIF